MLTTSAQWHQKRQREMLDKYPCIASMPRHNSRALIPISITPLIYIGLAYLACHLSYFFIFLLAYTGGALCNFAIFKYSHEISHRLVSPKIGERGYRFLLRYLTALSLSPSVYMLFRFGHKPHHAKLGGTSLQQAKQFLTERHADIEVLVDRYYYQLKPSPDSECVSIFPAIFNHRILRLAAIGLIFPVTAMLGGTLLFHLVFTKKFIQSLLSKRSKRYRSRVYMAATSIFALYSMLTLLALCLGNKAIIFFLLSDLFQRGFLWHPVMCFPLATHRSWIHTKAPQPTTSIYGKLMTVILLKMNYHVEHHDFPYLPCRYLPKLKEIAPEYYCSLNSFKGYRDILKAYFTQKNWVYAKS